MKEVLMEPFVLRHAKAIMSELNTLKHSIGW